MFYLYSILQITFLLWNTATSRAFHNSRSRMLHYIHMMCLPKKFNNIQCHGFKKDNINFELIVRRVYGLLPPLSWPTTCSLVRLWFSRQKLWDVFRLISFTQKVSFLESETNLCAQENSEFSTPMHFLFFFTYSIESWEFLLLPQLRFDQFGVFRKAC